MISISNKRENWGEPVTKFIFEEFPLVGGLLQCLKKELQYSKKGGGGEAYLDDSQVKAEGGGMPLGKKAAFTSALALAPQPGSRKKGE